MAVEWNTMKILSIISHVNAETERKICENNGCRKALMCVRNMGGGLGK